MSLREKQEGVEKTLEAKADEVERHEQKIGEVESKLQSIESAISNISEDAALRSKIEKNLNERQREMHDEERNAEILRNELAALLTLVNEGEKTNAESAAALDDLRTIGEDVEDAEKIVKERETWAQEAKRKIDDLMRRLDGQSKMQNEPFIAKTRSPIQPQQALNSTQPQIQPPRILNETQQVWQYKKNGTRIFNEPGETGQILDAQQGKVEGFRGTCGLVSIVNVLRMAGVSITEMDVVEYASTHQYPETEDYLCVRDRCPNQNGSTTYYDRKEILKHFGVQSDTEEATVDNIANAVEEGKGVIISVDAGLLWKKRAYRNNGHAVTVTSVAKCGATIKGFFVCDSGKSDDSHKSKYYSIKRVQKSLRHNYINVTSYAIR